MEQKKRRTHPRLFGEAQADSKGAYKAKDKSEVIQGMDGWAQRTGKA
jgi:hypothetical protein